MKPTRPSRGLSGEFLTISKSTKAQPAHHQRPIANSSFSTADAQARPYPVAADLGIHGQVYLRTVIGHLLHVTRRSAQRLIPFRIRSFCSHPPLGHL